MPPRYLPQVVRSAGRGELADELLRALESRGLELAPRAELDRVPAQPALRVAHRAYGRAPVAGRARQQRLAMAHAVRPDVRAPELVEPRRQPRKPAPAYSGKKLQSSRSVRHRVERPTGARKRADNRAPHRAARRNRAVTVSVRSIVSVQRGRIPRQPLVQRTNLQPAAGFARKVTAEPVSAVTEQRRRHEPSLETILPSRRPRGGPAARPARFARSRSSPRLRSARTPRCPSRSRSRRGASTRRGVHGQRGDSRRRALVEHRGGHAIEPSSLTTVPSPWPARTTVRLAGGASRRLSQRESRRSIHGPAWS